MGSVDEHAFGNLQCLNERQWPYLVSDIDFQLANPNFLLVQDQLYTMRGEMNSELIQTCYCELHFFENKGAL